MTQWTCITCDQKFDDIPAGAVQLTPGERRINTHRFPDGTIHSLRKVRGLTEPFHRRWHKTPKIGCEFCFPPPEPPKPEPVEQELLEKPEPQPKPVVVADAEIDKVEPTTAMAQAFHRLFRK